MNQERKKAIQSRLKEVIPKTWKWSLRVENHTSITLTIKAADVDLIEEVAATNRSRYPVDGWAVRNPERRNDIQLNEYHLDTQFTSSYPIMARIKEAMNVGNHDRSDIQSDYFDVGWYAYIHLGRWDRPFKVLPKR